MIHKKDDIYYWLACENAKDDYWLFGIRRTDKEVENEAEKMRNLKNGECYGT